MFESIPRLYQKAGGGANAPEADIRRGFPFCPTFKVAFKRCDLHNEQGNYS